MEAREKRGYIPGPKGDGRETNSTGAAGTMEANIPQETIRWRYAAGIGDLAFEFWSRETAGWIGDVDWRKPFRHWFRTRKFYLGWKKGKKPFVPDWPSVALYGTCLQKQLILREKKNIFFFLPLPI